MRQGNRRKQNKIRRMRPKHLAGTFDWLDCDAPTRRADVGALHAGVVHKQKGDLAMFRIHNNTPPIPALSQRLNSLRFDGRQQTHQAVKPPTIREQMTIVGRPTEAERHRAEIGQIRQVNHGVAAAATVGQLTEVGLKSTMQTLQELYQLSLRAQDTQLTESERQQLIDEARRLRENLDQLANSVRFNGIPLLNGAQRALTFRIGSGVESAEVHLALMDARSGTLLPTVTPEDLRSPVYAQTVSEIVNEAIQAVQQRLDKTQGFQERLETTASRLESASRLDPGRPSAGSPEEARQLLEQARAQILSQPAAAMMVQATLLSQHVMAFITP